MRRRAILFAVALLGAALLAGCGGGGGGGDGGGQGSRVSDPALVPTSTPIQNPPVYKISGDTIQILGGTPTTVANNNATPGNTRREYTVEDGDTCAGIAARLGITPEQLLGANRTIDRNCSNLNVGQKLIIPGAGATPGSGSTSVPGSGSTTVPGSRTPTPGNSGSSYTVVDGDTCAGIATKLGTAVEALRAANPSINADCSNLQPGQVLKKP